MEGWGDPASSVLGARGVPGGCQGSRGSSGWVFGMSGCCARLRRAAEEISHRRKSVSGCCCGNARGNPDRGSQRGSGRTLRSPAGGGVTHSPPCPPLRPRGAPDAPVLGCSQRELHPAVLLLLLGALAPLFWGLCPSPALLCPPPQPCLGDTGTSFLINHGIPGWFVLEGKLNPT